MTCVVRATLSQDYHDEPIASRKSCQGHFLNLGHPAHPVLLPAHINASPIRKLERLRNLSSRHVRTHYESSEITKAATFENKSRHLSSGRTVQLFMHHSADSHTAEYEGATGGCPYDPQVTLILMTPLLASLFGRLFTSLSSSRVHHLFIIFFTTCPLSSFSGALLLIDLHSGASVIFISKPITA